MSPKRGLPIQGPWPNLPWYGPSAHPSSITEYGRFSVSGDSSETRPLTRAISSALLLP
jgi:hypothetical protein